MPLLRSMSGVLPTHLEGRSALRLPLEVLTPTATPALLGRMLVDIASTNTTRCER
jgi:hypothetical protein